MMDELDFTHGCLISGRELTMIAVFKIRKAMINSVNKTTPFPAPMETFSPEVLTQLLPRVCGVVWKCIITYYLLDVCKRGYVIAGLRAARGRKTDPE